MGGLRVATALQLLVAAAAAPTSASPPGTTVAMKVQLDHPRARCLDGSSAILYLRPGWGSGAAVWNLFQEGGGSCHSLEDCAKRAKTNQGSTAGTHWPATIDLVGKFGSGPYFSPDAATNPLLWNANVAYIVYCDGGGFSGDNTSTVPGETALLHFRGQQIIRAAIAQLAAHSGLSAAKSVVVSGCSEGGVATYAHLDWMARLIKEAAPGVQRVAGLADSGFYPGPGSPFSHVPKQEFIYTMQNASGCLNPQCLAANEAQPWACIVADVNHRYIETPVFAFQSIFDTNQLGSAKCKDSACAVPYMHYLNTSVVAFATAAGKFTGAFIDMCSRHCNKEPEIDGDSSLVAFAKWFAAVGEGGTVGGSENGGSGGRLWMQRTALPFNSKAPYCTACCRGG
jgi:hypothetical protein